jgi:uncharacterized protein YutE (UPF0331/DUF86 family)
MTDSDLVLKKLAFIETCVNELRTLARPERIGQDVREERFVEHSLQLAIQAALDAASHLVSAERLGEPETNRELFTALERHGWIASELAERLTAMAGFRNILVHGYQAVNLDILRDILAHHLDDLLAFSAALRNRL